MREWEEGRSAPRRRRAERAIDRILSSFPPPPGREGEVLSRDLLVSLHPLAPLSRSPLLPPLLTFSPSYLSPNKKPTPETLPDLMKEIGAKWAAMSEAEKQAYKDKCASEGRTGPAAVAASEAAVAAAHPAGGAGPSGGNHASPPTPANDGSGGLSSQEDAEAEAARRRRKEEKRRKKEAKKRAAAEAAGEGGAHKKHKHSH